MSKPGPKLSFKTREQMLEEIRLGAKVADVAVKYNVRENSIYETLRRRNITVGDKITTPMSAARKIREAYAVLRNAGYTVQIEKNDINIFKKEEL